MVTGIKYAKTPPQKYIDQAPRQTEWLAEAQPSVKLRRILTSGTRCPDCWDNVTQSCNNPNCLTCYGTGWSGGYAAQESVKVGISQPNMVDQKAWTAIGFIQVEMGIVGWCAPSVNIKPRDMIVDGGGKRYVVAEQVNNVGLLGTAVRQYFELEEREIDDITYSVPIT
ncbi:MAG: hypothetical protein M1343_08440 [Chloroflexi bacterium]|nr:hypothetical protein [Chloroflexota bacterium]